MHVSNVFIFQVDSHDSIPTIWGNPIGVAKALDMAFSATCPSQMICFPPHPNTPTPCPPPTPQSFLFYSVILLGWHELSFCLLQQFQGFGHLYTQFPQNSETVAQQLPFTWCQMNYELSRKLFRLTLGPGVSFPGFYFLFVCQLIQELSGANQLPLF